MVRIIAFLLALLSGCVSVPDTNMAPQTAASDVVDKAMLEVQPGTGSMTIKRDSWPLHLYRLPVFLDGKEIGTIGGGEILKVYPPVGRHLVGVGGGAGGTSAGKKPASEVGVDVTAAKPVFVHMTLSGWGYGGWDIAESNY